MNMLRGPPRGPVCAGRDRAGDVAPGAARRRGASRRRSAVGIDAHRQRQSLSSDSGGRLGQSVHAGDRASARRRAHAAHGQHRRCRSSSMPARRENNQVASRGQPHRDARKRSTVPVRRRQRQRVAAIPDAVWRAPSSLANATDNRYTAQSYSVSPYIKGNVPGNVSLRVARHEYLVRCQWRRRSATVDSYTNEIDGRHYARSARRSAGRSSTTDRMSSSADQQSQMTEIGRVRAADRARPVG